MIVDAVNHFEPIDLARPASFARNQSAMPALDLSRPIGKGPATLLPMLGILARAVPGSLWLGGTFFRLYRDVEGDANRCVGPSRARG